MTDELPKYQPTITKLLKPLGFKKDGNHWYRDFDTHVVSLNLDSSSYGGGEKSIVIRVMIKQLAELNRSFKNHWHANAHIDDRKMLNGALLTSHEFKELPADERLRRLEFALKEFAIPILHQLDTFKGMKACWNANESFSIFVEARELLGVTGESAVSITRKEAELMGPKEDVRVKGMKDIMRASKPGATFTLEVLP